MRSEPFYDERVPAPDLRRWVRTCWIQSSGAGPYLQRDLPTGGIEVRYLLGGELTLLGPLTSVVEQMLLPGSVIVGMRFWPGAPITGGIPARLLTDLRLAAAEVWGLGSDRLLADLAENADAEIVLARLSSHVRGMLLRHDSDPLVSSVVGGLMPWRPTGISALADDHAISGSQLRRRLLEAVGLSPKVLQRTLRFQGYLALAQAAAASAPTYRISEAGALAGYADQPHLTRECVRLTGRTPGALLGSERDVCGCGHDHSASYVPFLHGRAFRSIVKRQALIRSIP